MKTIHLILLHNLIRLELNDNNYNIFYLKKVNGYDTAISTNILLLALIFISYICYNKYVFSMVVTNQWLLTNKYETEITEQTTTCYLKVAINNTTNVMFSVSKLTIVDMKLSFMTTERMPFHVSPFSPKRVQMDSSAIFTTEGGLAIERTSTSCCFLIDRTAVVWDSLHV